mgnify:CR=1 FL=1
MRQLLLFILTLTISLADAAITIGRGPVAGQDNAATPNVYYQEFQDWSHADLRALDGSGGAGGRYNFNDGFDDGRDLTAFYSRIEGDNLYLRVDLYDLKLGQENANLDVYVAIDCKPSQGADFFPDFTDVKVLPIRQWERCIALYNASAFNVYKADYTTDNGSFLGSYYNAELDSVEFGIRLQSLRDAGWDPNAVNELDRLLYFTVITVKDGSNGGAGEIAGAASDATDAFFDDERGFTDNVINGVIASNATAGRAKYATIAHGNQSVNKNNDTRVHIFDPTTTVSYTHLTLPTNREV